MIYSNDKCYKSLAFERYNTNKLALAWAWLGFLVILDIAIPWFLLRNVEALSGAFLFWMVWAAVAIASAFIIFVRWREVKS